MISLTKNSTDNDYYPVDENSDKTEGPVAAERKNRDFDGRWIVTSFILVCIFTIAIWSLYDYVLYEQVTAEIVASLLTLIGYPSSLVLWKDIYGTPTGSWAFLNEATPLTPGVMIEGVGGPFMIVKACTGMQSGALLISMIIFTKRKDESFYERESLKIKFRTIVVFFLVLFIANAIRVTFHLWLVTFGIPFEIAHDALSKPIGFVGALIFAWVIEKMGVPIIDTFADWLEYAWYQISRFTKALGL